MNKPQLSDYNISENQYSTYKEYKNKCEIRDKKLSKIKANLFWVVGVVVYIGIAFFWAKSMTDDFTEIPTLIKNVTETVNLVITIVCVIFVSLLLFFLGLGLILTALISGILLLIRLDKLTMIVISHLHKNQQGNHISQRLNLLKIKYKNIMPTQPLWKKNIQILKNTTIIKDYTLKIFLEKYLNMRKSI